MKKLIKPIGMALMLLILASCSASYRMITRIHEDGKIEREVYALGDSAFLAGGRSSNPYLFQLKGDWEIENLEAGIKINFFGEEETLNVKAGRSIQAAGQVSFFSPKEEWMRPLAVPQERLEKHFRWFYTYYTYTCDFQELPYKGPVPLDKYITKSEQALLFQGDMTNYRGMNGAELYLQLEGIEQKFQEWFYHTQFELSYQVIEYFLQKEGDTAYCTKMKEQKEEVFKGDENRRKGDECSPEYICRLLDGRYETTVFIDLYKRNEEQIKYSYDEKCKIMELFGYQIKFELEMPGELISVNTTLNEENRWVWKVDAYRLLAGNYTLQAESRTMNIWAFCVTGLLILLGGYGILRRNNAKK